MRSSTYHSENISRSSWPFGGRTSCTSLQQFLPSCQTSGRGPAGSGYPVGLLNSRYSGDCINARGGVNAHQTVDRFAPADGFSYQLRQISDFTFPGDGISGNGVDLHADARAHAKGEDINFTIGEHDMTNSERHCSCFLYLGEKRSAFLSNLSGPFAHVHPVDALLGASLPFLLTNGVWTSEEETLNIHQRELLAIEFGLLSFQAQLRERRAQVS